MKVALTGGSYTARSLIASAQRSLNLYAESNPEDAQFPFTYYPTPGLRFLTNAGGPVRGLYRASNGDLYAAIGGGIYYVSPAWVLTGCGALATTSGPVYMTDNSLTLVAVDGTANGYTVDLVTRTAGNITDPAFFGGGRVDNLDTFVLFSKPNTPQFYSSPSLAVANFDPLYFANKSSQPDGLQCLIVVHREIWLIGKYTSEIWYNAGTPDFPFGRMPGAIIDQGTVAPASVQTMANAAFFLSANKEGQGVVLRGQNYQAMRISTHAVETAFAGYARIDDAIGMVYQAEGHDFYMLTFPSADATWVYDLTTGQWHERCWLDSQGVEHRHRANCMAFAYGTVVCGDWQNGALYALDSAALDDYGQPIKRLRSFPTMAKEGRRVRYDQFIADMDSGTDATDAAPMVSLRWSDDRGHTWGNSIEQPIGAAGQYNTSMQWRRLGMGRQRVFELSWALPTKTALNGAYVQTTPCGS